MILWFCKCSSKLAYYCISGVCNRMQPLALRVWFYPSHKFLILALNFPEASVRYIYPYLSCNLLFKSEKGADVCLKAYVSPQRSISHAYIPPWGTPPLSLSGCECIQTACFIRLVWFLDTCKIWDEAHKEQYNEHQWTPLPGVQPRRPKLCIFQTEVDQEDCKLQFLGGGGETQQSKTLLIL